MRLNTMTKWLEPQRNGHLPRLHQRKTSSVKYDVIVKAKATSTRIVEITNNETVRQCVKFRRIENY